MCLTWSKVTIWNFLTLDEAVKESFWCKYSTLMSMNSSVHAKWNRLIGKGQMMEKHAGKYGDFLTRYLHITLCLGLIWSL